VHPSDISRKKAQDANLATKRHKKHKKIIALKRSQKNLFCDFLWLNFLVAELEMGARLRWQSQPRQLGRLTRFRGSRAGKNYRQVSAGIEIEFSVSH
jgi:hypothetical protein